MLKMLDLVSLNVVGRGTEALLRVNQIRPPRLCLAFLVYIRTYIGSPVVGASNEGVSHQDSQHTLSSGLARSNRVR